jgi:hypothetical protein
MIYTLEVILALYGAAVIAIAAITIWGPGHAGFAPMASVITGKLKKRLWSFCANSRPSP